MLSNRQLRVNLLAPIGIVILFFKVLISKLSDLIVFLLNHMTSSGTYMRTGVQTFIKLILKKVQGPLLPYWPISLLNQYVKYLLKILA